MNEGIYIAIITAFTSILVAALGILAAALTYNRTKRHESDVQWQNEKLNHYKVLFSEVSDLVGDGTDKEEANKRLALARNTIALVAPQDVITALMAYYDEISISNPNRSRTRHDELLKSLLLAVRKDIGRSKGDNIQSFVFYLVGPKQKKS